MQLARETTALAKSYTLPDGRTIKLGPERFVAPEVLFNPRLANREQPGLAQMAFQCIQVCHLAHTLPTPSPTSSPLLPPRHRWKCDPFVVVGGRRLRVVSSESLQGSTSRVLRRT